MKWMGQSLSPVNGGHTGLENRLPTPSPEPSGAGAASREDGTPPSKGPGSPHPPFLVTASMTKPETRAPDRNHSDRQGGQSREKTQKEEQ